MANDSICFISAFTSQGNPAQPASCSKEDCEHRLGTCELCNTQSEINNLGKEATEEREKKKTKRVLKECQCPVHSPELRG